MNLLETANNAFLAWIAAPEALREARELLKERQEQELNAPRVERLLRRISDLEHNLEAAESSNANLTELVGRLEAELAPLRKENELRVQWHSGWQAWALALLRENGKFIDCLPDDAEARHAIGQLVRAKTEPSIPEPDPGEGWELCERNQATEYRCAHWEQSKPWKQMDVWWQASPVLTYRYRRPISKPAPQWVACTAEEELTADGK